LADIRRGGVPFLTLPDAVTDGCRGPGGEIYAALRPSFFFEKIGFSIRSAFVIAGSQPGSF
jgi:hypothetical protein